MDTFKVIIAGGRHFSDYQFLKETCDSLLDELDETIEIVSGTARGADKLGEKYAREKNYQIHRFVAQWDKFGKSAGYRRNAEMADFADMLIAFWDGESKGTSHMIDLANAKNLGVVVMKYDL